MTSIPELSTVAYVLGGVVLIVGLWGLAAPAALRNALLALPRSKPVAWVLTAGSLIWCALIVLHASLGQFEAWKPAIYVIAPVLFYLLVMYLDELLAPRALGGVLLMAANPVLYASRLWAGSSPLRYVMPSLAYAIVIAGVVLVLSPYRFRRWTLAVAATDGRCRLSGAAAALLGGFIVALGAMVF